ncbi:MAG: FeoB-associated Cys-rich membrane protein [Eubacterium sp.]|nr:FeoB-associated Cys-rich membrane protein [Eubacterium sp.]
MIVWLTHNIASIIVGLILIAIIYLLVRGKIKERKTGGCGCGCSSCNGGCMHPVKPESSSDASSD